MLVNVDCPWCDGPATVESADHDALSCAGCAIRVELAPDPAREAEARAA